MIKVRFAPSPTGEMHIGNLRTAIFNWIFAKQNKGEFFIRIEDTDEARSKTEYTHKIFQILKKMSIDFDEFKKETEGIKEGVLYQSLRKNVYVKYAKELFNKGFAFYCQCPQDSEILCSCLNKNLNKGVLRFKIPKNTILSFNDMVFGQLSINSDTLDNFALLRSDESPTYMLSVVIDDLEMEITHIIRGEDHKTNTFKQILLYEALKAKIPLFAHLPLIIGADNKKLSKRNGNSSVEFYLNQGFVPDAFFNILLKLGWGYKNEEIISKERILEIFNFTDIKKSPAKFDEIKCKKFSGTYLRNFNYSQEVSDFILEKYNFKIPEISKLYEEVGKRADTFDDFYNQLSFLFYKPELNNEISKNILDLINSIDPKNRDNYFNIIKNYCEDKSLNFKEVSAQIRLYFTGQKFSIDIFLILELLKV